MEIPARFVPAAGFENAIEVESNHGENRYQE